VVAAQTPVCAHSVDDRRAGPKLATGGTQRIHERAREQARVDVGLVRREQPARALRRETRLERPARGGAEPLRREPESLVELAFAPDRTELVPVERDVERAGRLLADLPAGDLGELGGECGIELCRTVRQRDERLPSRLDVGVRREDPGGGVRRSGAGLVPLEHAYAQPALRDAPAASEADHTSADDGKVEALLSAQATHLLPAPA
jgi:hypothetical protein